MKLPPRLLRPLQSQPNPLRAHHIFPRYRGSWTSLGPLWLYSDPLRSLIPNPSIWKHNGSGWAIGWSDWLWLPFVARNPCQVYQNYSTLKGLLQIYVKNYKIFLMSNGVFNCLFSINFYLRACDTHSLNISFSHLRFTYSGLIQLNHGTSFYHEFKLLFPISTASKCCHQTLYCRLRIAAPYARLYFW